MSCMVDVSVLIESLRSLDGVDAAITHEEATLGNMLPRLRINSVSGRDGGPADRGALTRVRHGGQTLRGSGLNGRHAHSSELGSRYGDIAFGGIGHDPRFLTQRVCACKCACHTFSLFNGHSLARNMNRRL